MTANKRCRFRHIELGMPEVIWLRFEEMYAVSRTA